MYTRTHSDVFSNDREAGASPSLKSGVDNGCSQVDGWLRVGLPSLSEMENREMKTVDNSQKQTNRRTSLESTQGSGKFHAYKWEDTCDKAIRINK